jgi:hypothetical protein
VLEEEEEETGMVMVDMVDIQHSMVRMLTQVVEVDLEMVHMEDMVVQEVGEVEEVVEEDLMALVVDLGVMDILVVVVEIYTLVVVEEEEDLLEVVVPVLGVEMENIIVK